MIARRVSGAIACLLFLTGAAWGSPLDVSLGLRVVTAAPGATAALKDDLEFEILNALARGTCVSSAEVVGESGAGEDLRLEVALVAVEDETRNDLSIAERAREADPDDRLRVQVFFALQIEWRLLDGETGAELDAGRFRASSLRRPLTHMEDPHEEARRRTVVDAARKVARPLCNLSARKLERLRGRR